MHRPSSVDEYMASIEPEQARKTLESLRQTIKRTLPDAEEGISYCIPTYKQHGMIASIAAFKNHCSFFPGTILEEFKDQLKDYKTSKGTVQFPFDQPLPESLVTAILKRCLEENTAAQERKVAAKKAKKLT